MSKHVYAVTNYDEHLGETEVVNLFSNKKLAVYYINTILKDEKVNCGIEKWVLIDRKFAKQHLQYERED